MPKIQLTNSKLKKEERIGILADIATVLFSYDGERAVQDVMAVYPVIYVLGGKGMLWYLFLELNFALPSPLTKIR